MTLRLNAGHLGTIDRPYDLLVKDNGSGSASILYFNDISTSKLFTIDPAITINSEYKFFRVRDCKDLNYYYTGETFYQVGYDAVYNYKMDFTNRINDASNVIIEFYDTNKNLVKSSLFSTYFKAN